MSQGGESDRSQEATPHRMRKAREQGQVARGLDLGFAAGLLAALVAALAGGARYLTELADVMRRMLSEGIAAATDPAYIVQGNVELYWAVLQPLLLMGVAIAVLVIAFEVIQLRGFLFTVQPLKPDFQRLNPAQGLKRLWSMRMVKETLKSLVKLFVYLAAGWFVVRGAVIKFAPGLTDAAGVAAAIERGLLGLLFTFLALAFGFAVLDQLLVRSEFRKQMRMSRRDVVRETKDHEGEPRFKQRRRDLHAQLRSQTEGLGRVAGSDLVVVNPDHYAIALGYDPAHMAAPRVRVKGRHHLAQLIKRKAWLAGIPTLPQPLLARALYAECGAGDEVPPAHYRAVAALYQQARQTAHPRGDVPPGVAS